MENEKALQAILDKLDNIEGRLDDMDQEVFAMKTDIATISENYKATNAALESLLEWKEHFEKIIFNVR